MDSITVNGQEITFKPAPEFTFTTNLTASNGKPIKVEPPTKYRNGYEFYIQGGGEFTAKELETVKAATAILNERHQSEKSGNQAKRAAEVLEAQNAKLAGMDNVQIYDED